MPSRMRKVRKQRGSRTHGWGQIGQHRASGQRGGVGNAGMLKHRFIEMNLKYPDHFGRSSLRPPHPNVTIKWANVRDLDDLYTAYVENKDKNTAGGADALKKEIDLTEMGVEKLLGGGSMKGSYSVKVQKATASAAEKVKSAGGEVVLTNE